MIILQWCKMQIVCEVILVYIGFVFIREGNDLGKLYQHCKKPKCNRIFDILLISGELAVLFDGITVCTVNFADQIPRTVNLVLHLGLFVSYEMYAALLFWYWLSVTSGIPKEKWLKAAYILPSAIAVSLTIYFLPGLEFLKGKYTNYSMGAAVYTCFISVFVYCCLTIVVLITKYTYIPAKKRRNLTTTLICAASILSLQVVSQEVLVNCMSVVMITVSIYMNMENHAVHGLEYYQHEMIMGFATLVESKDVNTGGHIRRSSAYTALIAENLRENKKYRHVITRDYLNNLIQAAPMHDIGKIGIPDAILQKPGKLTNEEFETMKKHPVIGGKIIKDTFGHLYNGEYEHMAFQVARYHHEKWNGKGWTGYRF